MALTPLRFGIRYEPPSLAMEFEAEGKVEILEMPVPRSGSADDIFTELQSKHSKHLDPNLVSVKQIKRLLGMVTAKQAAFDETKSFEEDSFEEDEDDTVEHKSPNQEEESIAEESIAEEDVSEEGDSDYEFETN